MSETEQETQILPLRAGDFAGWLPLWRGYQRFYAVALPDEVTETTYRRLLNEAEPMFAALAWRARRAIGLVHYIFHRSTWTTGDYAYLQDLYVDEDVRAGGVGRALIGHVYDRAAAAGCSRVYWLTHESNRVAMHLYDQVADRSGFIQYRKLF